ncbi:MAG: hypothetical protein K1X74_10700 [Pirellulales bacterium]|nr:hypothetical protein [Pirellulales bacterium]
MNREVTLELDSYRLAQYAVQVPCYICDGPNTFDAEYCRHCCAPMAVSHQAAHQKVQPRLIATLGASGVGKTVYLGMLMDILSRQTPDLQLLARGAFSVTLQQTTIAALEQCQFPDKTPNEPDRWNWVHCHIRDPKLRRPAELVMPDLAGEALLEEVDHPHTYPVIQSLLHKCAGVLVLVDASQALEGHRNQDYFAMKLLSYLVELNDDPKNGWSQRPVALVFTKADQSASCFDDPLAFAQTQLSGAWQICAQRYKQFRFFATSVAGACAYRHLPSGNLQRIPLRIEPRGVVEPFSWLMERLRA